MNNLLSNIITLARQASFKILEVYHSDFTAHLKADKTPVTAADLASQAILVQGLQQLTPDLPIVSEEAVTIPFAERKQWQKYWLVDPLDGTKEFLEKNGEFTINIALIENHKPILGVIFAPVLNQCYFATIGEGAFKQEGDNTPQQIHAKKYQDGKIIVASSRRHGMEKLQRFLQQFKDYSVIHSGSALKFGLIAEGKADIYLRLGPTSEWDTAAGQCILEAVGGAVMDLSGNPFRYNEKESLINPEFLAVGDNTHEWSNFLKFGELK